MRPWGQGAPHANLPCRPAQAKPKFLFDTLRAMQRLILLAFWASLALLSVASLLPVEMLPPQALNLWDKAQHALGFAWLALLGLRAYPRHMGAVVIGLIAWGGVIELLQLASGWRYGDWIDWLADGIGVSVVALCWRLLPAPWTGRKLATGQA